MRGVPGMSFQVLAIVERINFNSPSRKAVAKQLASCANPDGGSIYPAVDYVAKHTDCSERTVQRCIKNLLQADILLLVRLGGKGRRSTNEYAYNMPLLDSLDRGLAEIYTYKNEKKQTCLGVRTVGEQTVSNDNRSVISKGDKLSPLKISKGDTVSSKGDTVSRKGDTVTPNPFKEPFKKGEAYTNEHQTGQRDDEISPTSDLLKSLFDEYNSTAKRAGFVPVPDGYFNEVSEQLSDVIKIIGVDEWRECLAIAADDKLCCGRVKPSKEFETSWRLDFKQMCKPVWVADKLNEWRRAGKKPKKHNPNAMTITPQSPSWNAWQDHFQAINHKFNLSRMANGDAVAVPSEWPETEKLSAGGGHA